jgi:hypothetical protein
VRQEWRAKSIKSFPLLTFADNILRAGKDVWLPRKVVIEMPAAAIAPVRFLRLEPPGDNGTAAMPRADGPVTVRKAS